MKNKMVKIIFKAFTKNVRIYRKKYDFTQSNPKFHLTQITPATIPPNLCS